MVKVEITGYTGNPSEKHGNIVTFSVNAGARVSGTKSADGNYEYHGDWYNCISFDKNLVLDKGTKVKVNGTLEYNKYNGEYKPRFTVDTIEKL